MCVGVHLHVCIHMQCMCMCLLVCVCMFVCASAGVFQVITFTLSALVERKAVNKLAHRRTGARVAYTCTHVVQRVHTLYAYTACHLHMIPNCANAQYDAP